MIASLRGKITLKQDDFIILDVAGVGYKVVCPSFVLQSLKVKEESYLFTHLHVSQDRVALYGFLEHQELKFFEMLISISGIGPKAALGILALAPVKTLKEAIAGENLSLLTKVSGIGKKTAARIILELKSKLKGEKIGPATEGLEEAIEALVGLGYSVSQARESLRKVPESAKTAEEKVREALKQL